MARPERYFIGPGVKGKLQDALTRVGDMPLGGGPMENETRITSLSGASTGRPFRGTFTGAWGIGETKSVTLISDTASTVAVTNYCVGVTQATAQASNVVFSSVGGTATVIEIQHADSGGLKRGTFTGAWNIGDQKTVTVVGSGETVNVTNYCVPVRPDTASSAALSVVFSNVQGTMTAVEVQHTDSTQCTLIVGGIDLSTLPGYDASAIQLLGHSSNINPSNTNTTVCVSLTWFSVTQCSNAAGTGGDTYGTNLLFG